MLKKIFYIMLASLFLFIPLFAQEKIEEDIEEIPGYTQEELEEDIDANSDYAQEEPEDDSNVISDDTQEKPEKAYIESFGNKFSLRLSLYQSNFNVEQLSRLNDIYNREYKITQPYHSNSPLKLGFGFLYGSFGLEFQKQTSLLYDSNYAKTESKELKLNYYSKSAVFEFHMKDFSGFHSRSEDTDFEVQSIGLSGLYIFNNKEYSWPAAFGIYERQNITAASWLLGGDALYLASERHLPLQYKREHIAVIPKIGYGITFAGDWNLFLSLSFTIGAGMSRELNDAKNHTALSNSYHAAIGYHWEDVSFVVSHQSFSVYIMSKKNDENYRTKLTQCAVTKRF